MKRLIRGLQSFGGVLALFVPDLKVGTGPCFMRNVDGRPSSLPVGD